jgi:sortase A
VDGFLAPAAPDARVDVSECGAHVRLGETAEATKGGERRRPHDRRGVEKKRTGGVLVTPMTGDRRLAAAFDLVSLGFAHRGLVLAGRGDAPRSGCDTRPVTDPRRFLLLLVIGLLVFGDLTVIVLKTTEPPPEAEIESPILVSAGASTDQLATTTTTGPAPATTSGPVVSGTKAITPPRDPYVPEEIKEIGTIEIPKIGLVHKMMHGVTLHNIDIGPSHWPGTPLPGENGNVVVMGHRVTHSHPFKRINELVAGDEVFFTVAGVRTRYVMTSFEIVAPSRLDIVNQTPTPTATLFACHPPGSAKQRYVVHLALAAE